MDQDELHADVVLLDQVIADLDAESDLSASLLIDAFRDLSAEVM